MTVENGNFRGRAEGIKSIMRRMRRPRSRWAPLHPLKVERRSDGAWIA